MSRRTDRGQTLPDGLRAGHLTRLPIRESKNLNTSNGTDTVRKKYTPITKDLKIEESTASIEKEKDGNDETIRIKVNNVAWTKRSRVRLVTDNEASSEAKAKRND